MRTYYHNSVSEPNTVAIGGGTGLSTMLRGLKNHTSKLTAIVTVADDGGGSGVLRQELSMPPPGDIRNCMQALANTEPTMQELLNYRFTEGSLKGQSFGNLFLAAMNGICSSFDEAVMKMGEVLALTGRVLPVSTEDVQILAEFENGAKIIGESKIGTYKHETGNSITKVRLLPDLPKALPEALDAIEKAELLIIGPGSLYTSILPNLLTDLVSQAIARSNAVRVYVLNVMTQYGETEGFTASDHIRVLFDHGGAKLFDYCLANDMILPPDVLTRYSREEAEPTIIDRDEISRLGVELICARVADTSKNLARHDPDRLSAAVMELFRDKSPTRLY